MANPEMKGWRVTDGNELCQCYVRAENRTEAKKVAIREEPSSTLRDDWSWIELKVKRAPEFDERLSEVLMQQVGYLATEWEGFTIRATDEDTNCVCVYFS